MHPKSKRTALTVANAIEAATGVVHEVAGHGVSKHLNGSKVTRAALAQHVAARMNAKLVSKHANVRKVGQK